MEPDTDLNVLREAARQQIERRRREAEQYQVLRNSWTIDGAINPIIMPEPERPRRPGRVVNEYSLDDFVGTINAADIKPSEIARVIFAYGNGDWHGGFVLKLKSGDFCHLIGYISADDGSHAIEDIVSGKNYIDFNLPEHLDDDPIELNVWLEEQI